MIPTWSQHYPKMIPTWSQSHPKMIPKSSQNDPKMISENDPNMIPKLSQSHPKMIPRWPQNDPNVIPKWSKNDPNMIPKWSQTDPNIIQTWSQNDPKMIPSVCYYSPGDRAQKVIPGGAKKKNGSLWKSQNNVKKSILRFPTFWFTIALVIERKTLSPEARKQTRASGSLNMTSNNQFYVSHHFCLL